MFLKLNVHDFFIQFNMQLKFILFCIVLGLLCIVFYLFIFIVLYQVYTSFVLLYSFVDQFFKLTDASCLFLPLLILAEFQARQHPASPLDKNLHFSLLEIFSNQIYWFCVINGKEAVTSLPHKCVFLNVIFLFVINFAFNNL